MASWWRWLSEEADKALPPYQDVLTGYKPEHLVDGGLLAMQERLARAQIVSENCHHLVLRRIRGELMTVPRKDPRC